MKISVCTISFRHQLIGLKDIAFWARDTGFQGIELWGVHARNQSPLAIYNAQWMAAQGLNVPMISDYLPLQDQSDLRHLTLALCEQAKTWGAKKIRTFAGQLSSVDACADDRATIALGLREAATIAEDHGIKLLIETHPGTLGDTLRSTCDLLAAVDHSALAVNFDVLHVWEGGDDPIEAHRILAPHIAHYHLKNISRREDLTIFAPANVYAAAGRRDAMVPLFQGAYDYQPILRELVQDPHCDASLEWFGDAVFDTLNHDLHAIQSFVQAQQPTAEAAG
jgi:3-dehydroshikimate dehydratase